MRNHGCKSRRDGWWGLSVPLQDSNSVTSFGLDIKPFLRERNGAAPGVDAGVSLHNA